MTLHVYYHPDTDGTYAEMVVAPNQREAARLMGVSVGNLRSDGQRVVADSPQRAEMIAVAMSADPGTVWYRRHYAREGSNERGQWSRRREAKEARG